LILGKCGQGRLAVGASRPKSLRPGFLANVVSWPVAGPTVSASTVTLGTGAAVAGTSAVFAVPPGTSGTVGLGAGVIVALRAAPITATALAPAATVSTASWAVIIPAAVSFAG
jgi:hypothetical protein